MLKALLDQKRFAHSNNQNEAWQYSDQDLVRGPTMPPSDRFTVRDPNPLSYPGRMGVAPPPTSIDPRFYMKSSGQDPGFYNPVIPGMPTNGYDKGPSPEGNIDPGFNLGNPYSATLPSPGTKFKLEDMQHYERAQKIQGYLNALVIGKDSGVSQDKLDKMWSSVRAEGLRSGLIGDEEDHAPVKFNDKAYDLALGGAYLLQQEIDAYKPDESGNVLQQENMYAANAPSSMTDAAMMAEGSAGVKQGKIDKSLALDKKELEKASGGGTSSSGGGGIPKAYTEEYAKVLKDADAATMSRYTLQQISNYYKQFQKGILPEGPVTSAIQGKLSLLGSWIQMPGSEKVLAAKQQIDKLGIGLVSNIKPLFGPQISNADIKFMMEAIPNSSMSPTTFNKSVQFYEGLSSLAQQKSAFYEDYLRANKTIVGAQKQWDKYFNSLKFFDKDPFLHSNAKYSLPKFDHSKFMNPDYTPDEEKK